MTEQEYIGLKPEDYGEFVQETAETLKQELEDALERTYEYGFLTMGKSKPAERWQFFQEHTLAVDEAMLLDPDYLEKRKQGLAPILMCERLMQQYQLELEVAMAAGMEPPPEPKCAYPWPVVLAPGTARKTFELFQRDFTALWKADQRKRQAVEMVMA